MPPRHQPLTQEHHARQLRLHRPARRRGDWPRPLPYQILRSCSGPVRLRRHGGRWLEPLRPVHGNPTTATDPSGHMCFRDEGSDMTSLPTCKDLPSLCPSVPTSTSGGGNPSGGNGGGSGNPGTLGAQGDPGQGGSSQDPSTSAGSYSAVTPGDLMSCRTLRQSWCERYGTYLCPGSSCNFPLNSLGHLLNPAKLVQQISYGGFYCSQPGRVDAVCWHLYGVFSRT